MLSTTSVGQRVLPLQAYDVSKSHLRYNEKSSGCGHSSQSHCRGKQMPPIYQLPRHLNAAQDPFFPAHPALQPLPSLFALLRHPSKGFHTPSAWRPVLRPLSAIERTLRCDSVTLGKARHARPVVRVHRGQDTLAFSISGRQGGSLRETELCPNLLTLCQSGRPGTVSAALQTCRMTDFASIRGHILVVIFTAFNLSFGVVVSPFENRPTPFAQ